MFTRRLITRFFSSQQPRIPNFYKKSSTYIILLFTYFSYKLYNWEYVSARLQRALKQNLDNFSQPIKPYQGVHRETLISEVLNLCSKYITIVFAPRLYGKTFFLDEIQSSFPGTLLLRCDSNIKQTMESLSLPIKFQEDRFDDFLTALEFMLKKQEKPLLLVDDIEKLPENERKMLIVQAKKWNKKIACRVIITSTNCQQAYEIRKKLWGNMFILPQLTKEEIHKAVKDLPGYCFEDVEIVVDACVGGLDFVLDMIKSGKNAKEYLDEKTSIIQGHIRELTLDYEAKEILFNIATTAKDLGSVGELYSGVFLDQELESRGIMQKYPNGYSKFCNYFIYKTINDYFFTVGK
ncbi:hypothetical protein SteCoe_4075 [Stentor coeruleus]|uniref:ATPase domain-containing protein n=1 Tax=Stentor coeruleus TaxID=5963 RepID=A0A1R2CVF8_9CILI|nr:hypothetical protein SteCoe_4075 [Stentor coeruleus]